MAFIVEDGLAQAAHLSDLTPEQTRLALAVGLFAEDCLTLVQAAALAGQDRLSFQQRLAARGISLHGIREGLEDRPWMALRGSACFVGDPFAPVVTEEEVAVLQGAESGVGS